MFPWPLRVVGGLVVALLWWWGVVFDLWIVVASIEDAQLLLWVFYVMQIFLILACGLLFRGWGVCG